MRIFDKAVSRQGKEFSRYGELLISHLEGNCIELGRPARIIASGNLQLKIKKFTKTYFCRFNSDGDDFA
tara:strand:+ start:460 stop:666 length:207 start_codon:yes stop_codon:yes gene_type:complete